MVDGNYIEDNSGGILKVRIGDGEDFEVTYNGEIVKAANVKFMKRKIVFPVDVTFIDVEYADDFGFIDEVEWVITGGGEEF